ncbi:MAG: nucleotidyltransferase family protein, partial [Saprospiraceae bacterium]|nr:nucleotidyltransferase family protein [Saprospiraceae bacterium]
VVVGHEAERVQPFLANLPVNIIFNPEYATGMTTSIQAGIRAASSDTDGFMICLSDMPLIETTTYCTLIGAFDEKKKTDKAVIVQPVFEDTPGNPVIFSAWYKNEILALTFTEGCKPIVQKNSKHLHRIALPTQSILMDADTEAAYSALVGN